MQPKFCEFALNRKSAWEVLSDVKKRREWDSVDKEFDESIPSAKAKGDFFELYGPVFEKESRFSKNPDVPNVGTLESAREDVEAFYEFWFNFDSWRTFEALDEEETDNAEKYVNLRSMFLNVSGC